MKSSWNGHKKDRNRHKNRIKRSGQARLVYVTDINCNIPTTWRSAMGTRYWGSGSPWQLISQKPGKAHLALGVWREVVLNQWYRWSQRWFHLPWACRCWGRGSPLQCHWSLGWFHVSARASGDRLGGSTLHPMCHTSMDSLDSVKYIYTLLYTSLHQSILIFLLLLNPCLNLI